MMKAGVEGMIAEYMKYSALEVELSLSVQMDNNSDLQSLMIPVLLHGCETWTLNTDLKRRIDVFGNKCLCRIIGYR